MAVRTLRFAAWFLVALVAGYAALYALTPFGAGTLAGCLAAAWLMLDTRRRRS